MKTKLTMIIGGKKMPFLAMGLGIAWFSEGLNGFMPTVNQGTMGSGRKSDFLFLDPSEKKLELFFSRKSNLMPILYGSMVNRSRVKFTIVIDSMVGKKNPTALSGTYDFEGLVMSWNQSTIPNSDGGLVERISIDVLKLSAFEVSVNLVQ